jgi:hypothetical protein
VEASEEAGVAGLGEELEAGDSGSSKLEGVEEGLGRSQLVVGLANSSRLQEDLGNSSKRLQEDLGNSSKRLQEDLGNSSKRLVGLVRSQPVEALVSRPVEGLDNSSRLVEDLVSNQLEVLVRSQLVVDLDNSRLQEDLDSSSRLQEDSDSSSLQLGDSVSPRQLVGGLASKVGLVVPKKQVSVLQVLEASVQAQLVDSEVLRNPVSVLQVLVLVLEDLGVEQRLDLAQVLLLGASEVRKRLVLPQAVDSVLVVVVLEVVPRQGLVVVGLEQELQQEVLVLLLDLEALEPLAALVALRKVYLVRWVLVSNLVGDSVSEVEVFSSSK